MAGTSLENNEFPFLSYNYWVNIKVSTEEFGALDFN